MTSILKNKNRGFTLVELLVVVAIIGILATIILASLDSARMRARDIKRKSDLQALSKAFMLYVNDAGGIPVSVSWCGGPARPTQVHGGCVNNTDSPADWYIGDYLKSHGYISASPLDPSYSPNTCRYFYYTNSANTSAQFGATLENPTNEDLATMAGSECPMGNYRINVSL